MNQPVDLLLARDFDCFTGAVATDRAVLSDPEVLATLKEMAGANTALFDELCIQLETETDVDVDELRTPRTITESRYCCASE